MRRRELDERIRKAEYRVRISEAKMGELQEMVDYLNVRIESHTQKIKTLESFLLRGNSSPNLANRAPKTEVTVHPPKAE